MARPLAPTAASASRLSAWAVGALAALAALSGACGDRVTLIECPPGTRADGAECIPLETASPDATIAPDAVRDTVVAFDSATATADADGPTDTASPPDASPAPVGGACVRNADCADGTCLDWPDGYCTRLGCRDDVCPSGSVCASVEGGNAACLATCEGACGGAQVCKRLAAGITDDTDAAMIDVCVPVEEDAGGPGAACAAATECAGGAACLRSFPGGYCAALGCDEVGCPEGAACARVEGRPTCLRTCVGDGDECGSTEGAERKCGVVQAFAGGALSACISGVSGRELGEACASDFECESGTCQILGDGRCSQSQAPCFSATAEEDCGPAQFCGSAGGRVGICARPCAVGGVACPGASFCLAEGADPSEAWCRPSCGDDPGACDADLGLACRFGVPITSGGQGRYVCAATRARGFGATCANETGCASGTCLTSGDGGYCVRACGGDGYCPFGGACVIGDSDVCHRACFAESDCPAGFSCTLAHGASRPVCAP